MKGTMKRFALIGLAAGAAMLLGGCVALSVYPYYTAKEVVFEQGLVGDWTQTDDTDQRWKFEEDGNRAYRLIHTEKGKTTSTSQAHLFKLRDQLFLDVEEQSDAPGNEAFPPRIPSHLLVRVYQIKSPVRMALLNYRWLVELLDKDPKALRHHIMKTGEKLENRELVVTASTEELQQFIIKYAGTAAAWGDVIELKNK